MAEIKLITEDYDNFGHNNIIYKANINYSEIKFNELKINPVNSIALSSLPITHMDNNILLSGNTLVNQRDLFKLVRYSINKIKPPNTTTGPTLVMSLFVPNDKLASKDLSTWSKKYLIGQLKLCFIFNYFFPNGNYRNYFDYYMIENFKLLTDDSLVFSKNVEEKDFAYYSSDLTTNDIINQLLKQIYYKLVEIDRTIIFDNSATRFIYYFITVSRFYYDTTRGLYVGEKQADLYSYKLSEMFIENANSLNIGHITNGFIGQHMRFIALRQTNYMYNNINILAPKHLIWRDAHSTTPSVLDSEWITEINKLSNMNSEIYFLSASTSYERDWHGKALCNVNSAYYKKSTIAGLIQICNSTIANDDLLYLSTIGLPFIMCIDALPVLNLRTANYNLMKPRARSTSADNPQYLYGIDEYVLTEFFNNKQILKSSIYFNVMFLGDFLPNNSSPLIKNQYKAVFLLWIFLVNRGVINKDDTLTSVEIISLLESLREKKLEILMNAEETMIVGFLLSLVPNKYHMQMYLFDCMFYYDSHIKNMQLDKFNLIDLDKIVQNAISTRPIDLILNENKLDDNILKKHNLDCRSTILLNTVGEWCQKAYNTLFTSDAETTNCNSANYISGFYDDAPPNLDIGILRQPSDLPYAYEAMKKNQLLLPLNKSNYKLQEESKSFKSAIGSNVISKEQIKKLFDSNMSLIERIITYDYLAELYAKYDHDQLCILVWKTMNFCKYDVDPSWFNQLVLKSDEEYRVFNNDVKQLSLVKVNNLPWADYAFGILGVNITDDPKYTMQVITGGSVVIRTLIYNTLLMTIVILLLILLFMVFYDLLNFINVNISKNHIQCLTLDSMYY